MAQPHIIIVEDEEDIREILEFNLSREGFQVESAEGGAQGLKLIRQAKPDLILLDLMLPDIGGLEICRLVKAEESTRDIAIIMVTAKGEESDIVLGLGLGADDYIPKPFSSKELVARIHSVLRRKRQGPVSVDDRQVLERGPLRIDPERHRAWLAGESMELTATEFNIILLLARHPGRIFSRSQILTEARGELSASFERSVDAHVRTIRRKLSDHRDLIETVRSIGYRFQEEGQA